METCENCGRQTGSLETPHVKADHVVCTNCCQRLQEQQATQQAKGKGTMNKRQLLLCHS